MRAFELADVEPCELLNVDNTPQLLSALQLGTWFRQAVTPKPTDLVRVTQAVSTSRPWPSSATSGLFPLSPSMLEAEGRVRARLRGLDPQAVGDWCWALGVVLNYLSNDMVARQKSEVLASGRPARGSPGRVPSLVSMIPGRG